MIRIGLTSLLLLFVCGCSYLSKRAVNDLDAIEFAEMLCDQILLNQIAIEQFDMEELQSWTSPIFLSLKIASPL